jgi:hypothetical protein
MGAQILSRITAPVLLPSRIMARCQGWGIRLAFALPKSGSIILPRRFHIILQGTFFTPRPELVRRGKTQRRVKWRFPDSHS